MKWIVKEVIELTKVVEGETPEEALDNYDQHDAATRLINFTAKKVTGGKARQLTERPSNRKGG